MDFVLESYAGRYRLVFTDGAEWGRFYVCGREVGAYRGRGGAYAAAQLFGV